MEPKDPGSMDKKRWIALDIFRGIAVLSLIIFNGFYGFTNVPGWLTHAKWDGYTFADLIAPMFLFAVGMAMQFSLKKRYAKYGLQSVINHVLFRGFLLISFGIIGDIMCFQNFDIHWGTLEMIGGCTIFAAAFILFTSPRKRIFTAIGFIFGWHILNSISATLHAHITSFSMGGPASVIVWSSILIIGSAIPELLSEQAGWKIIALIGLVNGLIFLAFFSGNILPNKNLVNSSYIALSTCLCCLIFSAILVAQNSKILQYGITPYGKNALAIYMISEIFNQLLQTFLPTEIRLDKLLPYSIILILISSGIVFKLNSKNIVIKI